MCGQIECVFFSLSLCLSVDTGFLRVGISVRLCMFITLSLLNINLLFDYSPALFVDVFPPSLYHLPYPTFCPSVCICVCVGGAVSVGCSAPPPSLFYTSVAFLSCLCFSLLLSISHISSQSQYLSVSLSTLVSACLCACVSIYGCACTFM